MDVGGHGYNEFMNSSSAKAAAEHYVISFRHSLAVTAVISVAVWIGGAVGVGAFVGTGLATTTAVRTILAEFALGVSRSSVDLVTLVVGAVLTITLAQLDLARRRKLPDGTMRGPGVVTV